jgi:hypothetical protein
MVFVFIFPIESWRWRELGGLGGLTRFFGKAVLGEFSLTKICHRERSIAIGFFNRNAESRDLVCRHSVFLL